MTGIEYLGLGILIGVVLIGGLWLLVRSRRATLLGQLRQFFGTDPRKLAIVSRTLPKFELPNVQHALNEYVKAEGGAARVIGYSASLGSFENSIKALLTSQIPFVRTELAPPTMREVDIDVDSSLLCVESGLHLVTTRKDCVAVNVHSGMMGFGELTVEVLARTTAAAEEFSRRLRDQMTAGNVLRGKVLSIELEGCRTAEQGTRIRFHRFAATGRDEIILPSETLSLLERNTTGFFSHAAALKAAGRSVKRGILLHGKPGTGKTFTAKWLAQSLDGVTVILMSGEELVFVKECCRLARALAPAMVIMEDVDLIATTRSASRRAISQVTLHQLLNELDGLSSEAEVLFLLTTNQPESIEEALVGRPGRVDQAIEYPLPDAECLRRLIDLYGRALALDLKDPRGLVSRLEGASPAFVKELVRKAALLAIEANSKQDGRPLVTDHYLLAALRELLLGGGDLTRRLYGFDGNEPSH